MKDTLNIEVSQDLIRPIIETKIRLAIHEALGRDPQQLVDAIVKQAMDCKVDEKGNVNSSSYCNKYNYLEAMVRIAIREEAKTALQEVIDEQRPAIREAVKRTIMGARGASKIATAVVAGIAESVQCKYSSTMRVELSLIHI